ncbi:MAG: DNA-binding protein [Nitrospirae bacterium GWA2_42_11]|nr:MAG: DNA-binding protein [Nitrospirae bacterium GWA2_42_11]
METIVPIEVIEKKIYLIRGHKVMLDNDLAELYDITTKVLVQAVKRNLKRFPSDFMFQLNNQEVTGLRSQIVTSKIGRGGRRYPPYAFTEQGVAMLSSVLNSDRAIEVNIQIMRAFVKLREMIASHKMLAKRLDDLEKKYDVQFKIVFDAIRQLMAAPEPKEKKIGFRVRERRSRYGTS